MTAAWLALVLIAGPATIGIADCVEVNHQEVSRLLDLELEASSDAGALQVVIGCDERGVTLEVEDRRTGRRRARSLRLERTTPEARPRLVALAAAELAAAVLSETAPAPAPPPAPSETLHAAPAPAPRVPSFSLLAEVGGARFFSRLATTAELGLTARYEGWRVLEPSLLLAGSAGSVNRRGRDASAASLSISPVIGVHRRLGTATARVATGPRLALARLQASAALPGDQGGTFTAPWLGWLAQLGLATPLGPRLFLEICARTGYVLVPVGGRIAGAREVAVEGPWIGASLSLGARL